MTNAAYRYLTLENILIDMQENISCIQDISLKPYIDEMTSLWNQMTTSEQEAANQRADHYLNKKQHG